MKFYKSSRKYLNRTKEFWFTYNPEINYNEIIINPNKSLQSTETAVFETVRFSSKTS